MTQMIEWTYRGTVGDPVPASDPKVQAIVKKLRAGRSAMQVAESLGCLKVFVEAVADHFGTSRQPIYESARAGSPRKEAHMPSVNDTQLKEIQRIFKTNGSTRLVVAGVAKQYGIAESLARKLGTVFTEAAPTPTATQVATDAANAAAVQQTSYDAAAARRTEWMANQVTSLAASANAAEATPRQASTQQLEAWAGMAFTR